MGVTSQNNTIRTKKFWEVKLWETTAWIFLDKLKQTSAFHLTMAKSVIIFIHSISLPLLLHINLNWNRCKISPLPPKRNHSNYNLSWLMIWPFLLNDMEAYYVCILALCGFISKLILQKKKKILLK